MAEAVVSWVVFFAFVAVCVGLGASACASLRPDRLAAEWDEEAWQARMRERVAEYAPPPAVLSHVAADGEVMEFPIIRGESVVSLATTLGEIAALPEVAA